MIALISGAFGALSAYIPVKLRERKLRLQPQDYTKTLMTGFQDLEQITRKRLKEMHEENSKLREEVKCFEERLEALEGELKQSDKKIHELETELSKYKGE